MVVAIISQVMQIVEKLKIWLSSVLDGGALLFPGSCVLNITKLPLREPRPHSGIVNSQRPFSEAKLKVNIEREI